MFIYYSTKNLLIRQEFFAILILKSCILLLLHISSIIIQISIKPYKFNCISIIEKKFMNLCKKTLANLQDV